MNITQYLNDEIHEQLLIGNAEAKENINKISNTEDEFYKKDFSLCIASASINHIQFCLPEGDINQFEKNAPQIGENRFGNNNQEDNLLFSKDKNISILQKLIEFITLCTALLALYISVNSTTDNNINTIENPNV